MSKMDSKEINEKVKEVHMTLKKDAENCIIHKFPERIVHLNEMIKKPEFSLTEMDLNLSYVSLVPKGWKVENYEHDFDDEDEENGVKNPRLDSISHNAILQKLLIPSNKNIIKSIEIIKPYADEVVELTTDLIMWIVLLVPKIEDGDNFGVGIQEETLGSVSSVRKIALHILDGMFNYYELRAKLISKVVKWPCIEDYRQAIEELDQKQNFVNSLAMREIRNNYSKLHGVVIKNLEKIKKPKSTASHNYY